ncbi:MAG: hypothetical protein ABL921_04330 [Pirellula sp.]
MSEETSRITELRRALSAADPTAYLVEARVIRRVIRDRHGFANLSVELPHTESQVVSSDDVRKLTHPDELGLNSFSNLADHCLLICEPDSGELDHWPLQELKQRVWRRLFHASLDRELRSILSQSNRELLRSNIAAIGQVEFDEAHYVLRTELRLMTPNSRDEAWRELVSLYSELRCFEPDLLPTWFPSLNRVPNVEKILSQGLDIEKLFRESRLEGAPSPELISHTDSDEDRLKSTRRNWSLGIGASQSDRGYLRQLRKRDRANERGNTVYAITNAIRAAQQATTESKRVSAEKKAREDVRRLVSRFRNAIAFAKQDTDNWQAALWELAENSVHGFWNKEKRLLYDLQKVCLDHERLTYKIDLVKWIVTRGKRPIRRPLTSLREVAMAKHLASAASRLAHVRLSGGDRDRLTELIQHAAHLSESQMRDRMRPVLRQMLLNVNLVPRSIPEQVAFDKVIEESIDCIADRGYLTMGYLRDVISKNDLKLPDLKELKEVWHGDQLLRADDQLDLALDGVYRRGEFYLRSLQVVSSFFFGTRFGRFATMYLIIPFGGAVVIVEGAMHIVHMFHRTKHVSQDTIQNLSDRIANDEIDTASRADRETSGNVPSSGDTLGQFAPPDGIVDETGMTIGVPPKTTDQAVDEIIKGQTDTLWWVLIIGLLLMALIHVPSFRKFMMRMVKSAWDFARTILFETPLQLLKLPILKSLWNATALVRFRRFVVVPMIVAIFFGRSLPGILGWQPSSWWWVLVLGFVASGVLNSRIGRDAQELTRDWLANALHQVQARLVFAFIGWVVDFFRFLLNTLERILYAVDEWLRFHSDENWLSILVKAILGVAWSFVSFLIRIYVNLLIEPTFHPVKHFPVVTVAHKIFLPALIMLEGNMVHFLGQYVGTPIARSITWFNIFFLPGFFGFAVWELKENWRLYLANRKDRLSPVSVGSHGETIARLLRPGFHSGTLPKIYRKLRKLEHQDASLLRFTSRRSTREKLHHVEHAIQAFADRELISLLQKCPVWEQYPLKCSSVEASSNSFSIELECPTLGASVLTLRMQEQSGWIVACVAQIGWLKSVSDEQWNSFCNAMEGFYRKCGVDLVREQLESRYTKRHPYDINHAGILIWPTKRFDVELVSDLKPEGIIRPEPELQAAQAGLAPTPRGSVVFSASYTRWSDWEETWNSESVRSASSNHLPPACYHAPSEPVVVAVRDAVIR